MVPGAAFVRGSGFGVQGEGFGVRRTGFWVLGSAPNVARRTQNPAPCAANEPCTLRPERRTRQLLARFLVNITRQCLYVLDRCHWQDSVPQVEDVAGARAGARQN